MRRVNLQSVLLVLLVIVGCSTEGDGVLTKSEVSSENSMGTPASRAHEQPPGRAAARTTDGASGDGLGRKVPDTETPIGEKIEVDWSRTSPLDFLETLKGRDFPFTVWKSPPAGWIREEHVEQLMGLVESKEPAAPVVSAYSSFFPFEAKSTVGNEAMFLIAAFREDEYPPRLVSVSPEWSAGFKADPDEYRKWWSEHSLTEGSR